MVCASNGRTPWPSDPSRSKSRAARFSCCSALRAAARPRCCASWGGSRPPTPAPRPELGVLLRDEPLSNLDPSLRERTRRELRALIKRVWITTIFVTHEQEEAFDLGDRVAVLQAGRLEQLDTADELYEHPASLFVAMFVGRANVLRGKMARMLGAAPGQVLVVRPERLALADAGGAGVGRERRYTGGGGFYLVETETGDRLEGLARPEAARLGDRVYLEAVRGLTFPEERA